MRTLIVATVQQWRAQELAAAAPDTWTVQHSFGFDVPAHSDWRQVRWWTPQEHAVRLLAAKIPLSLQAPDPYWLARQPETVTKRDVWIGPLSDIDDGPDVAWWKPATIKCDRFPAAYRHRSEVHAWADSERAAGRDPGVLLVQASADAAWEWEARCILVCGHVAGAGIYLDGGAVWHEGGVRDGGRSAAAAAWLARQVDVIDFPDGVVIDVGYRSGAGFSIVEANPVWASTWYGIDPSVVIAACDLAGDPDGAGVARWRWQPDPFLVAATARKRPLVVAAPPTSSR